jgi:hypothetical protein
MKTYACIVDGSVFEVIKPMARDVDSGEGVSPPFKAGDEIPIAERFTPEFVATLVDFTDINPQPAQGWAYDGKVFSPPTS